MTNDNQTSRLRLPGPGALRLLSGLAILVLGGPAAGQDWSFDPIIKVAGEYDDNAELDIRTDSQIDLRGLLLEASADIGYQSPQTSFLLSPRILSRNYSDQEEFNSDDIFVKGAWRHNMRSSNIGLRLNFDQQSVRTAERADTEFVFDEDEDVSDTDSGRVALKGDRTRWRVMPSWGYRFSNTKSISADINYFNVDFEDVFLDRLKDYTDIRGNFFFRHDFSNVNSGVIQLTGRDYETADGTGEVYGYGASAGVERDLSETTRLRAMLGFETTEGAPGESDDTVPVGNITLIQTLQTIRILAEYRRNINATGAGRLSTRDSVAINFTRQLNDKISAGIGVRAYQSRGLDDSLNVDDRDYVQLRSSFVWNMSRTFSVEIDYRYTMLNRVDLGERANSNNVLLWLSYQPTRIL